MSRSPSIPASPPAPEAAPAPPYAASWLHRLIVWFEALPGPTWVAYLVVFVGNTLFWHLIPWSQGTVPVGSPDPASFFWGFLGPALLWIAAYLERGAASAFDAFRPALTVPPAEADRLRYALIVVPAPPAAVIAAMSGVLSVGAAIADPATYTTGVPAILIPPQLLIQAVYGAILFQLLYRMVRQMNLVRRILDEAVAIDVFRPGPLNAFATLTARPGIVISLLVGASIPITPIPDSFEGFLVGTAPYLVVPPLIAIITFVVPLAGAHARLADQKASLQDDAEVRIQGILADLNRDVDAREVTRADGLNKLLGGLLVQRDILAKLSTWPWSTSTLRGFVSAILLPMAVFLLQQGLSRLIQ